ncbi:MAG: nitrous oxide-stimulated promoter family protein [Bacteroidaceae bacterium]|nr:nitrous oxide-stimulated promoter family protein [Bacteroidaceae bacterium]
MTRIDEEKRTVEKMIRLYCRRKEGNRELCPSCSELLEYAVVRLSRCRFGNDKSTCQKCPVHCYKPVMRDKMREVMRWAGPRMMLYHPVDAIRHLVRKLFLDR